MRRNQKIGYLTLALAFLALIACIVSGLGNANAHVVMASGWQMELKQQPEKVVLTSTVLGKGNTVLLNDLPVSQTRELLVPVSAKGGTISGRLNCYTDEYLTATCSDRQEDVSDAEYTITLTPTETAKVLRTPVTSVVKVQWNDDLWANFQVTLIPDESLIVEYEEGTEDPSDIDDDTGAGQTDPHTIETLPPDLSQLSMAAGFVDGMTAFSQNELLVLDIVVPEVCNRIELGLDNMDFPALTRYSMDGGATYITLYDDQPLVIEPGHVQGMTLVLDLQNVPNMSTSMTVYGYAYYDDSSRGVAKHDLTLLEPLHQLTSEGQIIVIDEDMTLTTEFPGNIGGAVFNVSLVRLDGTTDRMPYLSQDDSGAVIIRTTGDGPRAGAGAYRLTVNWTYGDVVVAQRELEFYVNYTDYVRG